MTHPTFFRRAEFAPQTLLLLAITGCAGPLFKPRSPPATPSSAPQAAAPIVSDNYDQFDHFHTLAAQFVIDFGDHTSEKVKSWTDPSGAGNAVVQDHTQTDDVSVAITANSKTPGVVAVMWTPQLGRCTYTTRTDGLTLTTCHYDHFCSQKPERGDVRVLADGKELMWATFASAYSSIQNPGDAQQWAYVSYDEHVDTTLPDADFQALAKAAVVRLRFCGRELDLAPDQIATLRAFWQQWSAVEASPTAPPQANAP